VRTAVDHLAVARARYDRVILADEPTLWAALDLGSPEWMRGWFPVPLTAEYTGRLRSKNTLLCDSRDAGIATPRFQICMNEEQLRCAARCIGFPVFIKATRGLAGSGLLFVRNMADLESQKGRISFENPLLVQAEIDGEPGSVSVLYENGIPVCWFSYLMTRTWPNRFSSASTIRMFPHPEAAALTASIGRLTQFNGLAGIDFIVDARNNRLILLEFNPRPTPVYHLGPRAGVDFGKALRGSHGGESQPAEDIPRILRMIKAGLFETSGFVTHRTKLAAINEAIATMRSGESIHTIIHFE